VRRHCFFITGAELQPNIQLQFKAIIWIGSVNAKWYKEIVTIIDNSIQTQSNVAREVSKYAQGLPKHQINSLMKAALLIKERAEKYEMEPLRQARIDERQFLHLCEDYICRNCEVKQLELVDAGEELEAHGYPRVTVVFATS
jgi:hypothetical protein